MVDKGEKYDRIISHASLLFARADFQSVCMEDVANAAKVGKGTLYNYFKSKDDLYFSILENRLEKLLLELEQAYNGPYDFIKNMKSLILHLHNFLNSHPHFHKIWNREEHSLEKNGKNDRIIELKEKLLDLIMEVLEQGKKEMLIAENLDMVFMAQLIYIMINNVNCEKNPDKIFSILMKGIGTEGIKHDSKK